MTSSLVNPSLSNPEMERSVIGALLAAPEMLAQVRPILTPGMFSIEGNGTIYQAIIETGELSDITTVTERLRQSGRLTVAELTTGPIVAYLAGAMTEIASALNVRAYAEIVYEAWRRRVAMDELSKAATAISSGRKADEVSAALSRALVEGASKRGDDPTITDILAAYDADREKERDGKSTAGILTGIHALDSITDGWRPGKFVVVAGRPGEGKTTLMLNFAARAAKKGHRTVVFSLEMGEKEIMRKLVADVAGVNTTHAAAKQMTPEAWDKENEAKNTINRWPLHLPSGLGYTVDDIAAKVHRLNMRGNPIGLIIVDYLQLMSSGQRTGNRVEEVSIITRGLKALAMTLQVPIIAGSQLSRAVADGEPKLEHLRESGSIEQDADIVAMLHNPNTPGQPNTRELFIRKNREGAAGKVPLIAQFHISRFAGAAIDTIKL